ncbi:MAG: GAF domain-containing protein, partial [Dehalococcoidia bacterium]
EEEERRRSQELQTLFDIASILGQPGAFEDKVTQVLEEVVQVVQAHQAALRVYDEKGETLHTIAVAGSDNGRSSQQPSIPHHGTLTGMALQQERPIVVNNYQSHPQALPYFLNQGLQSVALLPIKATHRVLGLVAVESREPNHFTPRRVRLLTAITGGMGALLANASLNQELQSTLEENRRRLDSFHLIARMLALEDNPDQTFRDLADTARQLVRARFAALAIFDPDGGIVKWTASGVSPEEERRIGAPPKGLGVLGLIKDEGKTLRLADVSAHPRAHGFPPGHPPMKSFLGTPIAIEGQWTGAFYVANREGASEFSEDDERLLNLMAVLAGALLDNANLYQSMAQKHSTLAAIQSSMTEGLAVVDSDGRVAYFNQSASSLLDLSAEEAVGRPLAEVIHQKSPDFESPETLEAMLSLVDGASDTPGTIEVALTQPHRRDLVVASFPILPRLGDRMTGLLLRDVTQERDHERRRDAFVSIASHELRTPMTTIMGFSELLLHRAPPAGTRKDWLRRIHKDSQRLTAVVDDLLNVSRIQTGKLSLNIEPITLSEVAEEALADIRPSTDKHEFYLEIPSDLPATLADATKLGQVFTNLLDNAVKYSPKGGRITISARHHPKQERVVVGVADQGIGISRKDQEQLFTTFHRIRRPEIEGIRGTGLGLYIVKELTRLMKGEVWLESELDKGSTFFFSLPSG